MNNLIKALLLIVFFVSSHQFVGASSYNYPYVCSHPHSHLCFRTETGEVNVMSSGFFMSNTNVQRISNLRTFMNMQANLMSNYYGNTTFTISGYYTGTGELLDRELRLEELLNINQEFYIAKTGDEDEVITLATYESGLDYLYTHFTEIINELHQEFPIGQRKNRLRDYLSNIVSYDHSRKSFRVRNICPDSLCYSSEPNYVYYLSTSNLFLLNGFIRPKSDFVLDVFRVSENYVLSDLMILAGDDVSFNFGFEDYLDVGSNVTRYSYTISYAYDGGVPQELFTEIISVDQDYNIISDTITPEILNEMIEIEVLSDIFKQIRIGIREGVQLNQFGKVTFFLSAENLNTGDTFPTSAINPNIPVQVIPSNTLGSIEGSILGFTNQTNNLGYNVGDTFSVILYLYDEFSNRHYDYIDGYDISLTEGTSTAIELSRQGSEDYADVITGVKSSEFSPHTISFKFRITEPGFHTFEGFDINARYKNSNSSYSQPPEYSEITLIPDNLFHNGQKLNIYVKSPLITDFDITCTNEAITLEAVCTSDNFSGCNPEMNESITFTSEADNGSIGTLSIRDYAYNLRNFNYVMNHIDQTAPMITVFRGLEEITSNSYSFKANTDPLSINFFESTTSNCEPQIDYRVSINGVIQFESIEEVSNFDLDISDFFRKSRDIALQIQAYDKYGNVSMKDINFKIFPDALSLSQTTIASDKYNTKYANDNEFYNYTLTLRDQFSNPISGKSISSLSHDCSNYTSCSRIINDVRGDPVNSQDSFTITNISGASNNNGEITFRLRSRAPGVFTNVFGFNFADWDNNYQNIGPNIRRYVDSNDTNSFNRLFVGSLDVSDDGGVNWSASPSYGTELDYKLHITSPFGVAGLQTQVLDFSNSIRAYDESTSLVEGISNISGLNTKNPNFKARINASGDTEEFGVPGVKLSNQSNQSDVLIRYNINGNVVTYVSQTDSASDRTPISVKNETDEIFLGVEVIGLLQGLGNTVITGQDANISNIATSEARNQIRQNAITQTRGLQSGQIINGVKFIRGDIVISGEIEGYETLVVQNGNVTINGDLNTNQNRFGIIVLNDNYDVINGYLRTGNVYVAPNVSEIYAAIYADGALVSVNSSGIPYSSDSSNRNDELRNQLYLKGSLFTRNTIGGGIISAGMYTLPGGRKITADDNNFTRALSYDLNYIRRGINNCIESSPGVCRSTRGAFVIENDPGFRVNPPRLF